jgi:FAD/FMN-containing dehydrogenase
MSSVAAVSYDGHSMQIARDAVEALRAGLKGGVSLAGEQGYDASRTVWNAMIDRRPALAVRCLGTADVVAAVKFARAQGIAVSIRGGGHNIAGLAVADGAMLLDMSLMRGVFVDAAAQTASVQAGCLLSDVDRETQMHGLAAVLGFVSNTGAVGLTLGGGFGYLTRRFGWTTDTVRSMSVVTADGHLVRASDDENADLFWGLRGGGGNFGVVTNIEYALYPVGPEIVGGAIAWRAEEGPQVLETFRKLMTGAPPEVTCMMVQRRAPPAPWIDPSAHGRQVVVVLVCHTGPLGEGEAWAKQLKGVGSPVGDMVQRRSYVSQQSLVDATQPFGRRNYWKSEYLPGLEPGMLETLLGHSLEQKSPHSAIAIFPLDGPLSDLPDDHSPVGNRKTGAVVNVTASWESAGDDAINVDWARATWQDIKPFSTGGNYVNFLAEGETEDRLRDAYGENFARLVELKRNWDPDNFFRCNKNIAP